MSMSLEAFVRIVAQYGQQWAESVQADMGGRSVAQTVNMDGVQEKPDALSDEKEDTDSPTVVHATQPMEENSDVPNDTLSAALNTAEEEPPLEEATTSTDTLSAVLNTAQEEPALKKATTSRNRSNMIG